MTTYTKETALYDTGAIAGDIQEAGAQVSKYITAIGDEGIKVHPYDATQGQADTDNYAKIDSDGMEIWQKPEGASASVKVAEFGADGAQIGQSGGAHSVIDADGQRFYAIDGTTQLANIGYGEGASQGGTAIAPYYTFGTRRSNSTVGNYSMAEGGYTTASGAYSHAEGNYTTASGVFSHAEGGRTTASGEYSHAEGLFTTASDYHSHAEGMFTTASEDASHAEGSYTTASGYASHAEGCYTTASGVYSHAQNIYTVATENFQTVIGKYNAATVTGSGTDADPYVYSDVGDYAFIIGNGTDNTTANRSNALTVDWDGHVVATSAKKRIMYTGEFISVYGNQTASETAGQITLSTSYKNLLPANKYSTGLSPLGSDLFSVSAGTVTLKKDGRYRIYGQIYIYNSFTVNDQVTACVTYNGTSSNLRSARTRLSIAAPYETLTIDTYVNAAAGAELQLVALNDTAARGKIGISSYTKMFVECLGIYE